MYILPQIVPRNLGVTDQKWDTIREGASMGLIVGEWEGSSRADPADLFLVAWAIKWAMPRGAAAFSLRTLNRGEIGTIGRYPFDTSS